MDLNNVLQSLSTTFCVHHIMVPKAQLLHAPDEALARQLLDNHPAFDVIPLSSRGRIIGCVERNRPRVRSLNVQDIVSEATSVLDVVQILSERTYSFVLGRNEVIGYVHFSDLNKQVVKLPFYVLLQTVEQVLFGQIHGQVSPSLLENILGHRRFADLTARISKQAKANADLDLAYGLSFREIVVISNYLGVTDLPTKEIENLARVRNTISHADSQLVEEHGDVKRLLQTRETCERLLRFQHDYHKA